MTEAATVCLESQGHRSSTLLNIEGTLSEQFSLSWEDIGLKVRRSWNNLNEAVEDAAYGLAVLAIWELTDYQVAKQSFKGSGFDYWLGEKNFEDKPFLEKAKLEVSGILNGTTAQINQRLKEKIEQTKRSSNLKLPTFVFIVEFSNPTIKIYINE
ncbi:MAG: hypothetical protein AAF806_30125 [Bacteroidota bacterium]